MGTEYCNEHVCVSVWKQPRVQTFTYFLRMLPMTALVALRCSFVDNVFFEHTRTHRLTTPLSRTTRVSQYQKGKTNLDFTEARDSEWQWHQLGHMQVCNSLQTNNHASTPPLRFLQAGCPSCRLTNSVKA